VLPTLPAFGSLAPAAVQVLVSCPGKQQCIRPRSTRCGLTTPHIVMLSLKALMQERPVLTYDFGLPPGPRTVFGTSGYDVERELRAYAEVAGLS
jgi:hypothetical protein